ncbi:MAG: iron ABC transporter permease [Deltaproteobacteria bacterium]|nr:iron ABC transporter permease [Deltaproteobacteria bacterium]
MSKHRHRILSNCRGTADPWAVLMVGIAAFFSLLILAPLAVVFYLSFFEGSLLDAVNHYSLNNYKNVFGELFTYKVLWNTAGFSFVALVVSFFFGIPTAWLVERTDFPGKTILLTFMTIGLLIPGFAVAMGWLFLLHPRIGIVNQYLQDTFGFIDAPLSITTITGMGWVQGLNLTPVAFIMTAGAFRAMDPKLEEAAEASGASTARMISTVTIPLIWPGVLAAAIYIFTVGLSAFDVPAIIGWSNRIFTFSTYMYLMVSPQEGLPKYGASATFSIIGIILAAILGWWYARVQKRSHQYEVITGKAYQPKIVRLGKRAIVAWLFIGVYLILSKLIPLAMLLWASLLRYFEMPSVDAIARTSLQNYVGLPWELVMRGAGNTSILMLLTPTITMVVSLVFAWVVLRSKIRGRFLFDFFAFLPHAVPNIIFAMGAVLLALFVLKGFIPIYGTIWLLLLLYVIVRMSYGTRMMNSSLIQIHRELEEAAYVSGGSTWSVVRRILVPILTPPILYGWLWIALLTYRELTLAVLLSRAENTTLPVVVWSIWLSGGFGQAAALTTVMLCVLVPIIALYWYVAHRTGIGTRAM